MPTFEQFPYAGLDFHGDTELVLPPGQSWGEMAKFLFFKYLIFYEFMFISIIYIYIVFESNSSFM